MCITLSNINNKLTNINKNLLPQHIFDSPPSNLKLIPDSGATGNFVLSNSFLHNVDTNAPPFSVNIGDDYPHESTGKGYLPYATLASHARTEHVIPVLKN